MEQQKNPDSQGTGGEEDYKSFGFQRKDLINAVRFFLNEYIKETSKENHPVFQA